jgi:hypothetical protein
MIGTITSPAIGSARHHPKSRIQYQDAQQDARQIHAEIRWLESACLAPLAIPAATRRFARANKGIATTDTEAIKMRASSVPALHAGTSVDLHSGDVCRRRDEAPAHNPQRHALDLFTSLWIYVVVAPPQQCCTGRNLNGAVETESDERNRSGDQHGATETTPSRML